MLEPRDPDQHLALDLALAAAADSIRSSELTKAWIQKSGLGLVMAIIVEAIQQNLPKVPAPQEELAVAAPEPATE